TLPEGNKLSAGDSGRIRIRRNSDFQYAPSALSINADGRMPAMHSRNRCVTTTAISPGEKEVLNENLKVPTLCVGDEEVAENLDACDRFEFLGIDEIGVHRERIRLAEKLHKAAVLFHEVVRQHRDSKTALTRAQYAKHVGDGQMRVARTFTLATDIEQPSPVLQMRRNGAAAEKNDAVLVEVVMCAWRAEPLEIIRRRIGM